MALPPCPLPPVRPAPEPRAAQSKPAIFLLLAALVVGSWLGMRIFPPGDAKGAVQRLCPGRTAHACPGPSRLDEAVCALVQRQAAGGHPESTVLLVGGAVSLLWLPWLAAAAARMGRLWPLLLPAGLLASLASVRTSLSLVILVGALAFSLRSFFLLRQRGHARARLSSALALALLMISTRLAAPALALCSLCIVGVSLRERGWVARSAAALTLFFPALVLAGSYAYVGWVLCH